MKQNQSNKQSNRKYAMLGLQFTSYMITPVLVCVLGGYYIQKKYNLGSWFMNLCVILSIILIISNLISFAKMAIKISKDESKLRSNKNEIKEKNK